METPKDVEELAYSLMITEFTGYSLPEKVLSKPYAGVILFAKNIRTEEELIALNREIKETSLKKYGKMPIISVDQEGGAVTRVNFENMTPLCGNMAIGKTNSEYLAEKNGQICALELAKLGFNLDFAPCADVNSNPQNPIIGTRSFGENPEKVANLVSAMTKGFAKGGILACAKHFPGHGDTAFDSHLTMPKSEKTLEELEKCELLPFKSVIEANIPMIMTSHICFSKIDKEGLPATLSKTILTDILREKLGFKGVIVTDSMAMDGIKKYFGYGEAIVQSIIAGADLIIACGSEEDREKAVEAIKNAVKEGRITIERLQESFNKIEAMKATLKTGCEMTNEEKMQIAEESAEQSIDVVLNNGMIGRKIKKTLIISPEKLKLSPHSIPTEESFLPKFIEYAKTEYYKIGSESEKIKEFEKIAKKFDRIILAISSYGKLTEAQRQLLNSFEKIADKTVVVSLNNPYLTNDIKWFKSYINSFYYGKLQMKYTAKTIDGE